MNVILLNAIMLNFIMLNNVMLNVVMLNVTMLNLIMLNVIMLNVVMPNVVAPITTRLINQGWLSETEQLTVCSAILPRMDEIKKSWEYSSVDYNSLASLYII